MCINRNVSLTDVHTMYLINEHYKLKEYVSSTLYNRWYKAILEKEAELGDYNEKLIVLNFYLTLFKNLSNNKSTQKISEIIKLKPIEINNLINKRINIFDKVKNYFTNQIEQEIKTKQKEIEKLNKENYNIYQLNMVEYLLIQDLKLVKDQIKILEKVKTTIENEKKQIKIYKDKAVNFNYMKEYVNLNQHIKMSAPREILLSEWIECIKTVQSKEK